MIHLEVAAAVIVQNGRVLLAKRNTGPQSGLWEFPGGKFEPGETWAQAIEREIIEELDVAVAAVRRLFIIEHEYPEKRVRLHFVFCRLVNPVQRVFSNDEVGWYAPEEFSGLEFCPPDRLAAMRLPWQELETERERKGYG